MANCGLSYLFLIKLNREKNYSYFKLKKGNYWIWRCELIWDGNADGSMGLPHIRRVYRTHVTQIALLSTSTKQMDTLISVCPTIHYNTVPHILWNLAAKHVSAFSQS